MNEKFDKTISYRTSKDSNKTSVGDMVASVLVRTAVQRDVFLLNVLLDVHVLHSSTVLDVGGRIPL